jgi:glutamate dehydrogenase (NAD(P)+)
VPTINKHVCNSPDHLLARLGEYGEVDHITNDELLMLDVDVLIPAVIEGQITDEIADQIRADVIVEGANGPTTFKADAVLQDCGITVVPEILANAGEVIESYFEWVQDQRFYFWSIDQVRSRLARKMRQSFAKAWDIAEKRESDLRSAVYMLAVD